MTVPNFNLQDYIDVQTRINRFWTEYPDGAIRTELASVMNDFDRCRYRAEVYKQAENPRPDSVGYAFELLGSGMANKTSHEENCETSAIGRALANMGYATSSKDRPSRQEMQKASADEDGTQHAQDAPHQSQGPQQAPPHQQGTHAPQRSEQQHQGAQADKRPATDGQKRALWAISGANKQKINEWAASYGESNDNITLTTASAIIDEYGGNR